MEIVIASHNTHKVLQIREILKELPTSLTILSLFDFPGYRLPSYDPALSFAENAKVKAEHAAIALQKCCIAEQWGLILPSVPDAAFTIFLSDPGASHAQLLVGQTKKILAALAGKNEFERTAYLESCVACYEPQGKFREAVGRTEGLIADSERGKGSFEFDTIFIKHDYMKTLAELSPSVRSRISHRRKAVEKLTGFLDALSR
jgi:XTP/dITP diphosphohydrolase